jgi:hypothetical protein
MVRDSLEDQPELAWQSPSHLSQVDRSISRENQIGRLFLERCRKHRVEADRDGTGIQGEPSCSLITGLKTQQPDLS